MDPFIGEIRIFAGNFPPADWAFCDGQLISIASNPTLYSLLLTEYGGDGITTFALPDLRGRVPIGDGTGAGLTARAVGEQVGEETVTLTQDTMPSHSHNVVASETANATRPNKAVLAAGGAYAPAPEPQHRFDWSAWNPTGRGEPHDNMAPYLAVNYIIALQGVYPSGTVV